MAIVVNHLIVNTQSTTVGTILLTWCVCGVLYAFTVNSLTTFFMWFAMPVIITNTFVSDNIEYPRWENIMVTISAYIAMVYLAHLLFTIRAN